MCSTNKNPHLTHLTSELFKIKRKKHKKQHFQRQLARSNVIGRKKITRSWHLFLSTKKCSHTLTI